MATTNMDQLWHLTAIRIQGLRLMRPEKSWRPILTVEVDKHHSYEFSMGCDGQNPNHKDTFRFHNASMTSVMEVKIWRISQTKKKGKRRSLVATASHSLGDLLKRQELERKLEIRLQCQRAVSTKGKPQNGALLHIQLRPPDSTSQFPDLDEQELSENDSRHATPEPGYFTDPCSSSDSSDTLNDPPSPTSPIPQMAQSSLRRRRIRGYTIFSDEEPFSEDYTSDEPDEPIKTSLMDICNDDTLQENIDNKSSGRSEILAIYTREIQLPDAPWFAASDLPQYIAEEVKVLPSLHLTEQILASFTVYQEMKEAVLDSHFEKVFHRLQQEWTYVGGLLVALAALNTGAFSLSINSILATDPWCRHAVAASCIATGLGIACDTWFLFRYNWADLQTFIRRAKDLFDSYFFFSLAARVPALCMLISGVSLMIFLGLVAYDAWPQAVLVISFLVGLIMSLQFLAYSAHWCAVRIVKGVKRIRGV
ncbi:hypothetical protein F5887DRAFT_125664 [Amanita rubescens]|nr:hypothetical protein F5887DRAFT_125664 [Amanita rubescens]